MSNCTAPHKRCSTCHRDTTTILIAYRHGFWKVGVACRGLVEAYRPICSEREETVLSSCCVTVAVWIRTVTMARVKIDKLLGQLDSDLGKALRDAVRQVIQM